METAPLFYWPTDILIVDDNQSFLENFSSALDESASVIIFDNPHAALEALSKNNNVFEDLSSLATFVNSNEYDDENPLKKIDYSKLSNFIYQKQRFNNISIAIVDYTMPKMNGVEFCKKISNSRIKKIMLTGDASYEIAVKSLNHDIIDAFVPKDATHVFDEVNQYIKKMRLAYFSDISNSLQGDPQNTLKTSQDYLKLFRQFVKQNNIVEYYQLDVSGSYLALDKAGHNYWLVIKSMDKLQQDIDVAKYHKENIEVLKKLETKTHLLFLFSEIEKKLPVSLWGNYIFPIANSFSFNNCQYFSAIIKKEDFSLRRKDIGTLQAYLSDR
ncbi:MAG TPA: response regulator [Gammaproteobacteria bacterium]|nr:response regulator [Gammaproteobacteria bacterium]